MNNKLKILNYLKKKEKIAVSRLAEDLKIHYYQLNSLLKELESEGKIIKEKVRFYTYIKLKI